MSIKKFDFFKKNPEATWRIIIYFAAALMGVSIFLSAWFIYRYIYGTLDNANAVIMLNSTAGFNVIDIPNYRKAEEAIKLKKGAISVPPKVRNIFVYVSTTPSHAATTTQQP